MALGTNPTLTQIRAFFAPSGPTNLGAYVRGGAYVPNIAANAAISTTATNLRISQFSGADKSVPPSISASPNPKGASASGRSGLGTISTSVALTCSGGNGSYSVSSSIVSQSGGSSPTHSATTTQGNAGITINGVPEEDTGFANLTIRYTVTSNGQTAYVDVLFQFSWTNNTPLCVVVETKVSPVSNDVAGDLQLDDQLWITDPYAIEPEVTMGEVRKSETHVQPCVRIVTANGAWLECSRSAPIPTQHSGYVPAVDLLGSLIPTITANELAEGNMAGIEWTEVAAVIDVGDKPVQLLYVQDRAFWASGDGFRFILHHNAKNIL